MAEAELQERIARLEGQVQTLTTLFASLKLPAIQPLRPLPADSPPLMPEKVRDIIRVTAGGNKPLRSHLTRVALEMLDEELDEDAIVRTIRDGGRVP